MKMWWRICNEVTITMTTTPADAKSVHYLVRLLHTYALKALPCCLVLKPFPFFPPLTKDDQPNVIYQI